MLSGGGECVRIVPCHGWQQIQGVFNVDLIRKGVFSLCTAQSSLLSLMCLIVKLEMHIYYLSGKGCILNNNVTGCYNFFKNSFMHYALTIVFIQINKLFAACKCTRRWSCHASQTLSICNVEIAA